MVKTFARFSTFTRGRIVGMADAGAKRSAILKEVRKTDGKRGSARAIRATLRHSRNDPEYDGTNSRAGGRPKKLSSTEESQLQKFMEDEVGIARVTIPYCQKRLKFLRRLSHEGVRLALRRLGLAYRLRRCKTAVYKHHKPARIGYSKWVKRQKQEDLDKWAYVDGTAIFLARDAAELSDKKRAALGRYVWRLETGQDSLADKNVGPSSYAKGQGQPIKIWGFFCDGRLEYYVLPKAYTKAGREVTTHMNGRRYSHMVKKFFAKWRRSCVGRGRVFVIKDHEKFLRRKDILKAERDAGCDQVPLYPKSSPDFNAIEGWWRRLKMYLESRAPSALESRDAFLRRLRRAVNHLNNKCRAEGRFLCRNQKQRARDCLKLHGARTKW